MEANRMKYLNFRIDSQWIKDHKVVNGFFILGQRPIDYNWDLIHEAGSMEEAKKYIKGIKETDRQRVYGPNGYGINL